MLRVFFKNNQMRITDISINAKIRTYLQSLGNQRQKLYYLQSAIRKVVYRKTILNSKYKLIVLTKCLAEQNVLSFCLKSLLEQADLMLTGRLFQSRSAAAILNNSYIYHVIRILIEN